MDPNHLPTPTISKEMENENAMSSVRRCACIKIESLEFLQHFESTSDILVTMSMENKRSKKLVTERFFANNGDPFKKEINGDYQLIYSHNVKAHRDPILRIAVENTRAKTFSRHRSIAAALVSMQQIVQHDFDGNLILYECHVAEKNPLGRMRVHICSTYLDDQEGQEDISDMSDDLNEDNSSDNDEPTGFARFSRSIRNIFASSSGTQAHSERDSHDDLANEALKFQSRPFSSNSVGTETDEFPNSRDLNQINLVTPTKRSQQHFRYLSDESYNSHSRGKSTDYSLSKSPIFFSGEQVKINDTDSSTTMEYTSNEGTSSPTRPFKTDLSEYISFSNKSNWSPFVILIQDCNKLQPLHAYLSTCTDVMLNNFCIRVEPKDCCDCIHQLYSLYNEKLTDWDLEAFRIFYFGDDSFTWHLLAAYLSLASETPTETFNIQFIPLLLTCSLSQLIASTSIQYLKVISSFYQFINATSSQADVITKQILEGKKGIWINFRIEQQLFTLIHSDYISREISINEASIQRSNEDIDEILAIPEISKLLSNDNGKCQKLKIPFLSDISVGVSLPFSPNQYAHLVAHAQKQGILTVLPDLLHSLVLADGTSDLESTLDYWLIDNDGKQCTLEGSLNIKNTVIQRLAGLGLNGEMETGFDMKIVVPATSVTKKRKKYLISKGCLNEIENEGKQDYQQFNCSINKMMMSTEKEQIVFIDGVKFTGVKFMTVNNHYFSRRKHFPLSIPFTE